MNSPLHRENILNKNYTETGVAVIQAKTPENIDRIILVQTFGKQFDKSLALLPTPTTNINNKISEKKDTLITPSLSTITNTTLPAKVLGLSRIQVGDNISISGTRTQEEARDTVNNMPIGIQNKETLKNSEFARISLSNRISSNDRIKYFSTNFFSNKLTKIINSISGISLIFIGITKTVIIKNKRNIA